MLSKLQANKYVFWCYVQIQHVFFFFATPETNVAFSEYNRLKQASAESILSFYSYFTQYSKLIYVASQAIAVADVCIFVKVNFRL